MHLLIRQKRLKDPDVLPEFNKADMAGTMETINGYLRSYHGFLRMPLVYFIRKAIIDQTHCDFPKCATPDNKIITRTLHLIPAKNSKSIQQSTR